MRRALQGGAARRFFLAHAQSCLGSGLGHVALPLLAFDKTGSPWAVTAVLMPDLLPAIVLGPLLGAVVDRVGWRACAITADLLRCLAFGVIAASDSMPVIIVAAAIAGTGTALFSPAALSGLGQLAPGDRRPAALGLFGALDDIGMTAGPALAALLLAGLPVETLVGANAVSFAMSAVLIAGIQLPAVAAAPLERVTSIWHDVRVGMRDLSGRPAVRLLLLSSCAAVLCAGVTNIGEVVLARHVLGLGGSGLALLVAAAGLGTVLGSLAARTQYAWQWRRAYIVGLTCMAVDLVLSALAPGLWLLLPVFVLGGFGNGFALVHDRLLLAEAVPDALHGRVFALQKGLTSLAFAASFAGASALIAGMGVQHTFLLAGAGMLAVVLVAAPRLRAAWPAPTGAPAPATSS